MSRRNCKTQDFQHGEGLIELVTYPDPAHQKTYGIFGYLCETHKHATTGETYDVRIYSSVRALIEGRDDVKQQLSGCTYQLLQAGDRGDVLFAKGSVWGFPDDILIYHDVPSNLVCWFTVALAKSYFGPTWESRFGAVERQAWSHSP